MPRQHTRREFFRKTSAIAVGAWIGTAGTTWAEERSAGEKLNVGIIGTAGRGAANLQAVAEINFSITPAMAQAASTDVNIYNQYYGVRQRVFGSKHPQGANFAFADGSVRFIGQGITLITLQALSSRAGEEIIAEAF